MRKGSANTSRGARRFIDKLVPRLRRPGASGEIVMRFIGRLQRLRALPPVPG